MPQPFPRPWLPCVAALVLAAAGPGLARAQESAPVKAPDAEAPPAAASDGLSELETRLAERYDRLELLVARLAELSGSTQPRRAALLRQLISQSRDRDVAGQFDRVVAALDQRSYSAAIDGQTALEGDLQKLLDLLLEEDRNRQIESQRKRIARYLQDVNRLIRSQREVKARTDGGDDAKELADDQRKVGERTRQLGEEITEAEETSEQKSRRDSGGDDAPGQDGQPAPGEPAKPPAEGAPPPSEGPPAESQPIDGQDQPAEGQPSQGQPAQAPSGDAPPDQQPPAAEQSPAQRAAQRLQAAQQRMEEARRRLEQAERDGAAGEQDAAVEELQQAKAELERILRQLREEELERMLVMLEARLRKMLDDQVQIYEDTKRLDAAAAKTPAHELEIASGRLARKELLVVREADRALVLLREDGTSVAVPEAIDQARHDMQSVADRLQDAKVDLLTQGLEEDVIAALEEALAAMQQALEDLEENKGQTPPPGESAPGEQPLVDQLVELRMIRALQARVNRRTEQYGAMIEGEQAEDHELLEALDNLSLRQQKIFQATRDLETKEN